MSFKPRTRWARYLWAGTLAIALAATLYTATARAATTVTSPASAPAATVGLVTRDKVVLRAAPSDSAASQTLLWRG